MTFRYHQFHIPVVIVSSILLCGIAFGNTPATEKQRQQLQGLNPGSERWAVKTSVAAGKVKTVTLEKLLGLANPIDKQTDAADDATIPKKVGGLKEGDIVKVEGWITLLALEKNSEGKDGDFHIQVHADSSMDGGCLIVEVPDPAFVKDADLKKQCGLVLDSAISKILHGHNFNVSRGNSMDNFVHVAITGHLFFDASHLKRDGTTQPRGKKGSSGIKDSSPTCWEIHPVTNIRYLNKKHK